MSSGSNMRIDITRENHELIKKAAACKGISQFQFLNKLLEYIDLADQNEKVILSIPQPLTKRNKDAFKQWLDHRMAAIIKSYYP